MEVIFLIEVFVFFAFLGEAFYTSDPIWAIAAALFYFAINYNEGGNE